VAVDDVQLLFEEPELISQTAQPSLTFVNDMDQLVMAGYEMAKVLTWLSQVSEKEPTEYIRMAKCVTR